MVGVSTRVGEGLTEGLWVRIVRERFENSLAGVSVVPRYVDGWGFLLVFGRGWPQGIKAWRGNEVQDSMYDRHFDYTTHEARVPECRNRNGPARAPDTRLFPQLSTFVSSRWPY
jgi:hypothetical protein